MVTLSYSRRGSPVKGQGRAGDSAGQILTGKAVAPPEPVWYDGHREHGEGGRHMGAGRPREDREIIDGVVKAVELFQKRADEYDALLLTS